MNIQVRPCTFCNGTGRCNKCDGKGIRTFRGRWFSFEKLRPCRACEGSGQCQLCAGKGKLGTAS